MRIVKLRDQHHCEFQNRNSGGRSSVERCKITPVGEHVPLAKAYEVVGLSRSRASPDAEKRPSGTPSTKEGAAPSIMSMSRLGIYVSNLFHLRTRVGKQVRSWIGHIYKWGVASITRSIRSHHYCRVYDPKRERLPTALSQEMGRRR